MNATRKLLSSCPYSLLLLPSISAINTVDMAELQQLHGLALRCVRFPRPIQTVLIVHTLVNRS